MLEKHIPVEWRPDDALTKGIIRLVTSLDRGEPTE